MKPSASMFTPVSIAESQHHQGHGHVNGDDSTEGDTASRDARLLSGRSETPTPPPPPVPPTPPPLDTDDDDDGAGYIEVTPAALRGSGSRGSVGSGGAGDSRRASYARRLSSFGEIPSMPPPPPPPTTLSDHEEMDSEEEPDGGPDGNGGMPPPPPPPAAPMVMV